MSVASGYVHISLRNAQNRAASGAALRPLSGRAAQEQAGYSQQYHQQDPAYSPLRSLGGTDVEPDGLPDPAVVVPSGPEAAQAAPDTVARGFVLYVGLDEENAAAHGTSLSRLAQEIRAHVQTLVPTAQSYAAVALAPVDAPGNDIDVVRNAFGDPTARRLRAEPARPAQSQAQPPRPSGVLIDLSRREVHLDGETLNLTFKEFELLNYLVENGTRTVGRDELLGGLWRDAEEVPNERTIDVHIRRLRSKLGRLANTVRTVRGQGYRFYEHPEVIVWAAPEYSI